MHDRYFFGADVFSLVWLFLAPRAWWIVALFQIGSALGYSYFMAIDHDFPFDLHPAALIGALAAIPATIGVVYYYWRTIGSPTQDRVIEYLIQDASGCPSPSAASSNT